MVATENKTEAFIASIVSTQNPLWEKFDGLRSSFVDKVKEQDFPTTRNEYWKYIRTAKIAKSSYNFNSVPVGTTLNNAFIPEDALESAEYPYLDVYKVIFRNGFATDVVENLPDAKLANIRSFKDVSSAELAPYFAKEEDNKRNIFNTLNSAYFNGGYFIEINGVLDKPLHIIHEISGENVIAQPRIIVVSKASSEATIVNTVISENANNVLQNAVNEIFVAENSNISFINIQRENEGVFHVNNTQGHQEKNSTLSIHHYTLTGDWVRNNTNILVNGENCDSNLYAAYTAKNKQQIDNHTVVDHRVAHCESNELYKGTANDKATVTFNGKVFVRKDAQKINAFQSNNNILLSDDATINSKPELEIYADDVKCSHGSTTGQLDEDALFYLRSRGLKEDTANQLLVGAFVGEVIENIKHDAIRNHVKHLYGLE